MRLFSLRLLTTLLLITLAWGLTCGRLLAHEIRPTIANLNLDPSGYKIELLLNLEAVMAEIGPQHSDTDESDNADRYNTLRAMTPSALEMEFDRFRSGFLATVSITDQSGQTVEHRVNAVDIPPPGNLDIARDTRLELQPVAVVAPESIVWTWPAGYGDSIIRVNQSDGETGDDDYSAFLSAGESSIAIPLGERIALTTTQVMVNYLKIGFTHIVPKGLDHILFVVGLFLLGAALRPLLIQITSFTLAHTVTLALGASGTIALSPAIVEPLIAASIVYVAIENMVSDRLQKWRPLIVFCFGLLHGLGFAGVLSEIGIASGFFFTALISFNIGVELGQLFVILICFLLVGFWFRHKSWYRTRITIPASLVIALIGLYWFVERVSG